MPPTLTEQALTALVENAAETRTALAALAGLPEVTAELRQRLTEVEQLGGRRRGATASDSSWGGQIATHADKLKAFGEDRSRKAVLRFPVTNALTSGDGLSQAVAPATRESDISMMPRRRLTVRALLTVLRVKSGSVEYARQGSRDLNAAPTDENTLKPESGLTFELDTTPIRTIPHWVAASRQILDDSQQLADLIDQELRYGVQLEEEAQVLFGDGTGQNLTGLVAGATAFAAPAGVADVPFLSKIDIIGQAITQATLADFEPNGVVIHPADWMSIRLTKDQDGKYIYGDPSVAVEPRIFGLPVVPTSAMDVDDFLVGDFKRAATLYDRQEVQVLVSTEHADFFTKNMVAILAEERIGLAIKQPTALVTGAFGAI
jgi:HK97 family phage major capsid protein